MRNGMFHPLKRILSDNPLAQGFDNLITRLHRFILNTVNRTAIFFVDDNVLRNINQTARQVTGVSGLQSRIGKTFPGSVCRNEEFNNVQPFFKV